MKQNIFSKLLMILLSLGIGILDLFCVNAEGKFQLYNNMMVAPDPMRAAFVRVVEWLKKEEGVNELSNLGIRPFNLRMLKELKANQNSLQLSPKTRNPADALIQPYEILIVGEEKKFFGAAIRIAVRKFTTSGEVMGVLYTYVDPKFFSNAGETASLEAVYNGTFDLKTDTESRIIDFPIDFNKYIPEQQQEVGPPVFLPGHGSSLEERGFFVFPPNFKIDNAKTNRIDINLKGSTASIEGAAGTKNLVQVDILGWIYDGVVDGPKNCSPGI